MEKFWQLLGRVNVRLVAALTILAVLAFVAWRLRTASGRPWQVVDPPSLDETVSGTNVLGETFFSWSRDLRDPREIERNLFSSPALHDFLARMDMERLAAERAAAEKAAAEKAAAEEAAAARAAAELAAKDAAEKPSAQTSAAATTSPAPREVVLVYRGMMIRPDHTVLAFVENTTDGVSSFHRIGENVAGRGIVEIGRNTLELIGDITNEMLTVSEPRTFKESVPHGQ